jgi:hypothetical protein
MKPMIVKRWEEIGLIRAWDILTCSHGGKYNNSILYKCVGH